MPSRNFAVAFCIAASAFAAAIPRPEFPEPQFERTDWLSLNGEWQFGFDDSDAGMDAHWYASDHALARTIIVPYCFESRLSGVGDPSFHPWAWYRRQVTLPESWRTRRTLLHFGAVDYQASVWVNGQLAGSHEGGNTPFVFDVTPSLKPGENVITVRAWDPPEDKLIPRGKQYWEAKSKSIFYARTSGIWQSVWMEAAGDAYLDTVHISTDPLGGVNINGTFSRARVSDQMRVSVFDGETEISRGTAPIGFNRAALPLRVVRARTWSVEDPKLYNATVETWRNDRMIDRVRSYFGFRTVEARDGRVWLNGKPVYLKFILDQGYWPESNLTPPSDEAIQYDIRMAQAMGFNGARKHQKVEDPRFLYWADRMGFLVSGEMANAQGFDEQYAARFNHEWMEAVQRDINHPSIVIWAPLNESWGVPDLRDQRQQMHLRELYTLTHTLDDSRLVIDNEGWMHTDQTDLFAIHDYTRNGGLLWERYRDLNRKPVRIPDNGRPALIGGYAYNGSPIYLSEFGGIAYIPQGHDVPPEAWGYSGVEKTVEDALDRLESIYRGIAKIPEITGICYTQLTDVEQEVNGLMTYDRKPKFDVAKIKALNDLLSEPQRFRASELRVPVAALFSRSPTLIL
jgi:beta-galactosidase/beta-glucuronidase